MVASHATQVNVQSGSLVAAKYVASRSALRVVFPGERLHIINRKWSLILTGVPRNRCRVGLSASSVCLDADKMPRDDSDSQPPPTSMTVYRQCPHLVRRCLFVLSLLSCQCVIGSVADDETL